MLRDVNERKKLNQFPLFRDVLKDWLTKQASLSIHFAHESQVDYICDYHNKLKPTT